MTEPGWHIRPAHWASDHALLLEVRETVFVAEQHVPVELERDALDPDCFHVLAQDAAGAPIGTGRLTPAHDIGRMAVLPAWRGQHIGAAMLKALIQEAKNRAWPTVSLHAQVTALGFYERFQFRADGDVFMEAGIRHRHMSLTFA